MEPVRHRLAWTSAGGALTATGVAAVCLCVPFVAALRLVPGRSPAVLLPALAAALALGVAGAAWGVRRLARDHVDYVLDDAGVRAEVERPGGRREVAWALRWDEIAEYVLAEWAPPEPSGLELRTEPGREGRWVRRGERAEEEASFVRFADAFLQRVAAPSAGGAARPPAARARPRMPGWGSWVALAASAALFLWMGIVLATTPPERWDAVTWKWLGIAAVCAGLVGHGLRTRMREARG